MGHFIIPIAFIKEWIHHQIQWFLNGLFAPEVIRNSIPVPHVTYRGTGRQTPLFPPPSFKEEVEGLLELVACDCVLMRERLQRGDKAPSSGWEVLGGIRIIIKKRHVFKKHTMEQGRSCHPPLLRPFIPPSLHPSTPPRHKSANWHSGVMVRCLQRNVTFPLITLCTEPNVRFYRLGKDSEKNVKMGAVWRRRWQRCESVRGHGQRAKER